MRITLLSLGLLVSLASVSPASADGKRGLALRGGRETNRKLRKLKSGSSSSGATGGSSGSGATGGSSGSGSGSGKGGGSGSGKGGGSGGSGATGGSGSGKGGKGGKGSGGGGTGDSSDMKGKFFVWSNESSQRTAGCATRGDVGTTDLENTNWIELFQGGDQCSSDCECASGCCSLFWVNICVPSDMEKMTCMGDGFDLGQAIPEEPEVSLELKETEPATTELAVVETDPTPELFQFPPMDAVVPNPRSAKCSSDSDCILSEIFCHTTGCVCMASPKNADTLSCPEDNIKGYCLYDNPCLDQEAVCVEGICEATAAPTAAPTISPSPTNAPTAGPRPILPFEADNCDISQPVYDFEKRGPPSFGADECQSSCQCASGCCAWYWAFICVDDTNYTNLQCVTSDHQVSRSSP